MASKQSDLRIRLNFDADVSKARREMESLQASLDKIMNIQANRGMGTRYLSEDIEKASMAAASLRVYLDQAFNARTGKLDLVKFNQSLIKSGLTAESLKNTLMSIGPQGQQAFFQLSQAVATSEIPIIRISDRMRKLGVTLANTAKWQFSSTALHAFVGSITSAYNYAQDLNESLNNIRIVTGQSVEQMSRFADRANQAARALSASTLAYTDAALIFYQQGLNDEEVAARAEATVKMSNITGQGAKEVSDQLTAIWNNFAKGSENLEYYADVITALGAATASSSEEISQGLGKFAAVADTVGLSYEKATAALATVIATTRQSADIVGTSFRTIFARLEGLSLGETLDDGVTLNKYSEALAKVGVNILNQQGELKAMDDILDELGQRWNDLNKSQQVGLAQTIAGVRQYSQFLALMDNYDYLLQNEQIAEGSRGTVQKQADIYAESWEAASKRVRASLEGLYTTLLDDQFFIDINDNFADMINYTKEFINSLGGLKGILTVVGTLLLSTFSTQIADRLSLIGNSIAAVTPRGRARLEAERDRFTDEAIKSYRDGSYEGELQADAAAASIQAARTVEKFNKTATEDQKVIAELQRQRAEKAAEEAIRQGEITKELEKQSNQLIRNQLTNQTESSDYDLDSLFNNSYFLKAANKQINATNDFDAEAIRKQAVQDTRAQAYQLGALEEFNENFFREGDYEDTSLQLNHNIELVESYEKALSKVRDPLRVLGQTGLETFQQIAEHTKNAKKNFEEYQASLSRLSKGQQDKVSNIIGQLDSDDKSEEEKQQILNRLPSLEGWTQEMVNAVNAHQEYVESANNVNNHLEILEGTINNTRTSMEGARDTAIGLGSDGERVAESANEAGHAFGRFAASVHDAQSASDNLNKNLKITGSTLATTSQAITTLGAALMQGTMAVNAVKSIFNILNNENLSTGEQILQVLTSMTMIIPVLTFVTNKQKIVDLSAAAAKILHMKANYALATSAEAATVSMGKLLIPVLAFVAAAAGIALLIYGIVKAFDALSNSESESEKAIREANEALEAAKENANATKNAYNDLKNEINDYTKTVDALAQYTKGTEEWRNASEQLNESIQNLISKYPELLKISNLYNSDGTLNQEVLNDFLEQKNVAATAAQASEVLAQRKVSTTTQTDREDKYLESIREILQYGLNGVASELAKAILQQQIQTGQTMTETQLQTLAYKAISDYENKYNVQFDDRAIDWNKILNSINSLSDSFEILQKESINLSTTLVNSNKSILGIYGDKFSEDPIQRLAQLDTYNQAVINKETELTTTYERLLKDATDNKADEDDVDYALGKIGDSKELFEFYQDWLIATGKTINETTKQWKLVGDDALDEDNGFQYYTGEGDDTAYISVAEMAAEMAAYKVGQEIDRILENPNSEFADKLINNPNGVALASFIANGNFNSVTISDIQKLQGQKRQDLIDLFGGDEEQLKKVLANLYGVESIDDQTLERFYANFEQGTQGNIINEALNGYTKYIQENLIKSLEGSLKLENLKPVADMYTKALAEGGTSGIEALNKIAERAGSESGPLMSVVAGLDLTAMSAEDVNKQLANAGIAFKLTETDITQLTQLLTDSGHMTLEAAQETYQAVSKVLSKLKDEGDIIDADQYKTLMQLNPALKSYFTMMADGTYMLTGAAEDFRTAVQSSQIAQLQETRNNQLDTITAYRNLDAESGQKIIDNYHRGFYGGNVLVNNGEAELTNTIPNMITALQDSNIDVTKWQAALNDPNSNLLSTAIEVAEKYQEIFSDADIFENKSKEALNKVGQIEEAIAFTRYQNDVSNAGLDYEETEHYAKILQEVNTEGEITLDQARQLAIANQRLDRGLKELNDNYEDWSESLKNTGENTLEYASTIGEARDALADLFNISSGDKLSTKWIDKLLKDSERMKKILDGDAEAIQDLRKEASGELVDNSNIEDSFRNIQDILEDIQTLNLGTENDNYFKQMSERLENATLSAQGFKDELLRISNAELGTGVSLSQEYTDALNAMLAAGLMTEQELNDIFASIGYKPTVTTGYVEQQALIPQYETTEEVTRTSDLIDGDPITGTFRKVTSTRQLEPVPTTQWVPVVQIASNENGGQLNVVNAGAQRITPSHGATSAGKKGKSGGSGGGGSRSKKDLKDANDEIERYHVIDKTIDVLAKKYDRLSASKDAAFGLQRLKYIEQENKLLEKQYKAEKIRLEEVKQYYAKDRGAIEAYGAIIDNNGVITNYEELMRREMGKLNAAYTAYNNGGLSDEIIAAKEKDYEKFKDILSQFEETNSEYLEQLKKVDEALRAQITGRLEAIKAKVEVDLELPEAELKEIEFKLKTLEDAAFASAEKIVLWGTEAEIAAQKFNTFADAFKEVLTMSVTDEASNKIGGFGLTADQANRLMNGELGVFDEAGITGENAKALMEALQEYWDNLINEYDAAYQARKNIEDELFNELNEYSDAIEKQISKLQKLVSIANNVKSIIGTMGRSNLGISAEVIDQINQNVLAGVKNQVTILKAEQDALEASLASANAELKDAIARNDQEAIQYWTNASQEIESNLLETKEKLLSQIEDYVKQAQEILAENIKENFAELARQTYNMTMEDAIASYDRYKTLSSDYLKDYQKIYELSKLTRAVQNSIDETPSLWIKEHLRDLQEEINEYQAEGVQMTRYEVDYLNRKYELRLAELALEEAQNSKDMVRLSRNADGGWGYVYTADQDNIDKAQSDYEEKLYALQQLNYQAIEDSQSTILQLQQEFEEKMIEIMTNNELSEEERNSRIAELQEYYIARMQVYYDTLDSALIHNRELYEQDWKWYNELTGYRISADQDYIDKFEETWVAGQSNGVNSVLEAFEKYKENLGSFDNNSSTLGECYQNLLDYKNQTNEVFKVAGLDVSNFSNTVSSTMHTIAAAINDARTSGKNLATELGTNLPNTIGNISSWQQKINPKLEVMKDTINRIAQAVQELIKKLNELSNTKAEINISGTPTGIVSTVPNPSNGGSNGGTGNGGGGSIIPEGTENDSIWSVRLVNRGNTNSFTYVKRNVSKTVAENAYSNEIKYRLTNGIYYSRVELLQNNSIYKSYTFPANLGGGGAYTPAPMATGGYTGDFGPEGRMAILHEKELVLNKQDTANMLKMVNIAREVLNNANLGLPIVQANRKIDPMFNNGINTQEIHIEASFPNVINHSEIEQAFERLANYSSQNAFNFDLTQKVNFF